MLQIISDSLPTNQMVFASLCLTLCAITCHMEGSICQRRGPQLREYRVSSLVPAVRLGQKQTDTRCLSPLEYSACQKYQASGEDHRLFRSRTRPAKP